MLNGALEGGYRFAAAHKNAAEGGVLVTVITVVYNGEKHLEHTIQSVLSQTYQNIEYIVVDGGSSDGTLNILRKYNNRIAYWKSEPDRGISDAFNKGIDLATGEVIGILNADDWYEPDAVSRMVAQYEPDSILHGVIQYWDENGSRDAQARPSLTRLPREMSLNHPTVFISKSLYQKYGTFDPRFKLSMDYHLLLRLYKARERFIFVDAVITNMRLGGASANIKACYREVLEVKNDVLGDSVFNRLYFYWMMVRFKASSAISKTPLSFITKMYRTKLSPIKRKY